MVRNYIAPVRARAVILDELAEKQKALVDLQVLVLGLVSELAAVERDNRAMSVLRLDADTTMIPLKEAARMAGRSSETIKAWASSGGFGWRAMSTNGRPGHWIIDRDAFLEHLKNRAACKGGRR